MSSLTATKYEKSVNSLWDFLHLSTHHFYYVHMRSPSIPREFLRAVGNCELAGLTVKH